MDFINRLKQLLKPDSPRPNPAISDLVKEITHYVDNHLHVYFKDAQLKAVNECVSLVASIFEKYQLTIHPDDFGKLVELILAVGPDDGGGLPKAELTEKIIAIHDFKNHKAA